MEIVCSSCGHVGLATTRQDDEGIALLCEACGHANRIDAPTEPEPTPEDRSDFEIEAFERLIPIPGDGERCSKCAHLLSASSDHCGRCGLSVVEGRRFDPDDGPWDKAPAGKEVAFEQAQLLWRSLEQDWTSERSENFFAFAREEGLTEFAARRLRFRLVEHPGDEDALRFLAGIASDLQTRVLVAKAQARASSEEFSEVTQRAKTVLMYVTFVCWMIIVAVVASIVRS